MPFQDSDIAQVVSTIWQSVLQMECEPAADLPGASPHVMAACVQITGEWKGTVILGCTGAFAARAAQAMFATPAEDTNPIDMQDAVAELANMIGGNLKALLPVGSACQLSLPSVVAGADYTTRVPGSRPINRVVMDCCGGLKVVINVLEKVPAAKAA